MPWGRSQGPRTTRYTPALDEPVTPDVDDVDARIAALRKEIRGLREDLRAEEFELTDALVDQHEGFEKFLLRIH